MFLPDNDFSSFARPENYIRYIGRCIPNNAPNIISFDSFIEPLESELAVQVEYDMDEQG